MKKNRSNTLNVFFLLILLVCFTIDIIKGKSYYGIFTLVGIGSIKLILWVSTIVRNFLLNRKE